MKKSAIMDIFSGKRGNAETMCMPKRNNPNDEIIFGAYGELRERLSPELLELYQKFVDALEAEHCDEVEFYFSESFKLGLLIGVECMVE